MQLLLLHMFTQQSSIRYSIAYNGKRHVCCHFSRANSTRFSTTNRHRHRALHGMHCNFMPSSVAAGAKWLWEIYRNFSLARSLFTSFFTLFIRFVRSFGFLFFSFLFLTSFGTLCCRYTHTERHTDMCIVYVVLSQLQSMWKLFMKNEMKTKKLKKSLECSRRYRNTYLWLASVWNMCPKNTRKKNKFKLNDKK